MAQARAASQDRLFSSSHFLQSLPNSGCLPLTMTRLRTGAAAPCCQAPPPDSACVVRIEQLTFGFGNQLLFEGLSAVIPAGVTLVKGGDGRGKTTLLRLLAGELQATAGELQINGIKQMSRPEDYRQQVFRCDTQSNAFGQHTPNDHFELQRSRWPLFSMQILQEAIDGLGLAEHLQKNIFMLSTGSKRKVWLAAAFAAGATVTLLDEPFAALDAPSIRHVLARLQQASTQAVYDPAAQQTARAWVVADYEAPAGLAITSVIDLGD